MTEVRRFLGDRTLFVLFVSLLFTMLAPSSANAQGNPPGVKATEADIPIMRYAGYKDPKVGQVWNPGDPNIGREAGEVKQWLAQHATKNVQVACFEPGFAKKLKAFMEAVPGGVPIITDGYRSPQAQARLPSGSTKAGPCQSYHQYGLAADFNSRANLPWMRANSRSYGINTIGAWDPGHFQDSRGRFGQCGACSGGPGGDLASAPGGGGGGIPSPASLGQSIRQALGLNQQPQPPSPPQAPPQQLTPQQQPLDFFQPTQPVTPLPRIPGLIPTTTSTTTKQKSQRETVIDDYETKRKVDTSIADRLLELAYGTSSIGHAVETATSVPIIVDRTDTTKLKSGKINATTTSAYATSTKAIHPTQTFISPDLSYPAARVSESREDILAFLADMRARLLRALAILRPFGLRASLEGRSGEYYAE